VQPLISPSTVLISPSLHLGLDLKDDLSRFQIITKVPYPSLGDRWIDEKRKRSEQWYSWQTGLRLVQAYGRSVRSKDDWAATYVLDANFGYFISRNKTIIPQWFIDDPYTIYFRLFYQRNTYTYCIIHVAAWQCTCYAFTIWPMNLHGHKR
jgi:hypothetical protein